MKPTDKKRLLGLRAQGLLQDSGAVLNPERLGFGARIASLRSRPGTNRPSAGRANFGAGFFWARGWSTALAMTSQRPCGGCRLVRRRSPATG